MSNPTGTAVNPPAARTSSPKAPKSAAVSKPTASPVDSPSTRTSGSDTGTEHDYELPSAADVAAHLRMEPDGAADDDASPEVDAEAHETDTPEEIETRERAIAEGLPDSAAEADTTEDAASDESETDAAEDDAAAEDSGADETTEEEPATAEADPQEAPAKTGTDKRIAQITAARRAAEEEAARLREQVAAAHYEAPAFGTLALVDDLGALAKAEQNELALHKWALRNEANPDGADLPDGKGGTLHYEPEQIREIKANTFEALYAHIPARKAYLQQKATAEGAALQAYPWLRQLKEGDGAAVQKMIEERPYLRHAPDYRTLAADALIGAKLRQAGVRLDEKLIAQLARQTQKPGVKVQGSPPSPLTSQPRSASAPVRRTAPSPSRPGVLPPRLQGHEAAARMAEKRLHQSAGSLDDISQSIAAKFR